MGGGSAQVVGIVGSYRRGGVTDTAVSQVLDIVAHEGKKTEKIYLADAKVSFCTNCRACMQPPGSTRVPCQVFTDDVESILETIEGADAIVIGAPVNLGHVNALTQRFIERCVGFGYWPWGTQGGPKLRNKKTRHKAVLISSSAAPAFMNSRFFGMSAMPALKWFSRLLGAKVVAQIKVGLITEEKFSLSGRTRGKIAAAARQLL